MARYLKKEERAASTHSKSNAQQASTLPTKPHLLPTPYPTIATHTHTHQEIGEEVEFTQLYKEVQQLCKANKITRFGCKKVCREQPAQQHTPRQQQQ